MCRLNFLEGFDFELPKKFLIAPSIIGPLSYKTRPTIKATIAFISHIQSTTLSQVIAQLEIFLCMHFPKKELTRSLEYTVKLVSYELIHFGVIARLFRQIGVHST